MQTTNSASFKKFANINLQFASERCQISAPYEFIYLHWLIIRCLLINIPPYCVIANDNIITV